ncbi:hypothetical protein ANAPC5_01362 [Anaplasma phagocytophilum]|nr:hypothetical protein ANAPC5_01362 [Anaplasma phagocytophilum]
MREALKNRNYPNRFINRAEKRMSRRRPDRAERTRDVVCIPYVKGVSGALERALRPLGVRTVYKPHRTIANVISKPKDPTPPEAEGGVI